MGRSSKMAAVLPLACILIGVVAFFTPVSATCGGYVKVKNTFNSSPLSQYGHILYTCNIKVTKWPVKPTYPVHVYFTGQKISSSSMSTTPADFHMELKSDAPSTGGCSYTSGWSVNAPPTSYSGDLFMGNHIQYVYGKGWENDDVYWEGTFTSSEPTLQFSVSWTASHYKQGCFTPVPTSKDYDDLDIQVLPSGGIAAGTPTSSRLKNYVLPGACGSGYSFLDFFLKFLKGSTYSPATLCSNLCLPIVKGEPHFTGGHGTHFDWSGEPGKIYNLVSSPAVQINMGMTGHYAQWGDEEHHALTWIRQLGIRWGSHSLELKTRGGPSAAPFEGFMESMMYDGEVFKLKVGESRWLADKDAQVAYISDRYVDGNDLVDLYEVSISQVLTMRLKVRPAVEALRTPEEAFVHFDFLLPYAKLGDDTHGVLGQTYRPERAHRGAKFKQVWSELLQWYMVEGDNGGGFLDGQVADYEEPTLISTESKYSRFGKAASSEQAAIGGTSQEAATAALQLAAAEKGARKLML